MSIRPYDFYNTFIEEGERYYNDLKKLKSDDFNSWVALNFFEIGTINSLNEVKPNDELFKVIMNSGYTHKDSQCHYSAKALSIFNPSIEYYTGFILRTHSIDHIITHSFNYYNSQIIDFARIDNKNNLIPQLPPSTLPHTYYGIRIPRDFIMKYEEEVLNEKSMKPLLYEWFLK